MSRNIGESTFYLKNSDKSNLKNWEIKSRLRYLVFVLVSFCLTLSTLHPYRASASTEPVLGAAGEFQIVSGAATTLGASITGLDVSKTSTSVPAVNDLRSAIAALLATVATGVSADLGGKTYLPGRYTGVGGTAFSMTSNIILDGQNDCKSIFIFITPAAMNTTAGTSITLINGAKASNVYWVAGGAITIGASSNLAGNFLSSAAVTVGASTSVNGRFLAMQAVTVGASVIFQGFPIEGCATPVGGLSISVPESVETRSLKAGETVTFDMGEVVVTDTRGISSGAFWSVSTMCEELRDGSGNVLSGENFSYSTTGFSMTGGLRLIPHPLNSMLSLSPILDATSGAGTNSATWNPRITISVPVEQFGGTYAGSIVHSVV
jgi:Ice-binding-like